MRVHGKSKRRLKTPIVCFLLVGIVFLVSALIILLGSRNGNKKAYTTSLNISMKQTNDPKIDKLLSKYNFVGTALIVKKGKVEYYAGKGYSNASALWTDNGATIYQINSIQKSLTAVLLMKLVEQHKVKLSDLISKYYPNINGGEYVTIKDMLQMRSGLSITTAPKKAKTDQQVLNYYQKNIRFTLSELGEWRYSEVNYSLLAGVISQASGMSYEKYFNKEIINYLNLKSTGFVYNDFSKKKYTTLGYANRQQDGSGVNYKHVSKQTKSEMRAALGTGNVYMNAKDLFITESAINQGKIISKFSLKLLRSRPETRPFYSGGLYNTKDSVYARGGGYGYETYFRMNNKGNTGVVLLSNYYQENSAIQYLANKIFKKIH